MRPVEQASAEALVRPRASRRPSCQPYARWQAAQPPGRTSRSTGVRSDSAPPRAGSGDGTRTRAGGRGAAAGGPGCLETPFRTRDGRLAISIRVYGWSGSREDVADRRDLDQPPGVHDAEAVDELGHQPHVVAHQDDGEAPRSAWARARVSITCRCTTTSSALVGSSATITGARGSWRSRCRPAASCRR